jgi:hypothetical protein
MDELGGMLPGDAIPATLPPGLCHGNLAPDQACQGLGSAKMPVAQGLCPHSGEYVVKVAEQLSRTLSLSNYKSV